jgi:RNA polymerase sigma-70 factor (ECF subfamily)
MKPPALTRTPPAGLATEGLPGSPASGAGFRDDLARSLRFADVFRDQHAFVARVVARLLGPADPDVDDVVQEVFLVVLRKLGSYDGACRLTTWLYGIAWRVTSAHRRRRRLRSFFSLDHDAAVFDEPVDERPSPEAACLRDQASRDVYRVLDRLAEKKREVLILYELEGLSGTEIAELLGAKEGTVWTRLHHARRDFRRLYSVTR